MAGVVITGCYQDVILPDAVVNPDGPPQAVSFKTTWPQYSIHSVLYQAVTFQVATILIWPLMFLTCKL